MMFVLRVMLSARMTISSRSELLFLKGPKRPTLARCAFALLQITERTMPEILKVLPFGSCGAYSVLKVLDTSRCCSELLQFSQTCPSS